MTDYWNDPWVTGIVGGFLASIVYATFTKIFAYFGKEARLERKRLKACRMALYNLNERFHISNGQSSSTLSLATLTSEHYIWCLFELHLVWNGTTGKDAFPNDTDFINEAKSWFNDYKSKQMEPAIEVYTPYEMNNLLIEVIMWGINGRPWRYKHLPKCFNRVYNTVLNFPHRLSGKSTKTCNFLYRNSKLPPNNNVTKCILDIIQDADNKM
ncbi:hypothetical protein FSU_3028 [Fibrobacter succinogenes subsp. succinogenes S85]|uniref:Uncharacterized protein n=1 Tax=Fibrobacter succinogenes (strain ATCC 19169 / S85) TaxID=59374 RepID=C9RLN4_FIBSS|nr:hypothetical protein [Fibrobacter succinogenes]ACX76049.1 hypothetical protein Fisuc_2463 [Fibrobacter succinogenes subsp. succinogenes S85]ADL25252.1 hypothetical protein FSU_3028 [Fibrobacter succinogenes subsp. succinogenes S85]